MMVGRRERMFPFALPRTNVLLGKDVVDNAALAIGPFLSGLLIDILTLDVLLR